MQRSLPVRAAAASAPRLSSAKTPSSSAGALAAHSYAALAVPRTNMRVSQRSGAGLVARRQHRGSPGSTLRPKHARQPLRATSSEEASVASSSGTNYWEIKYLYDGDCALCRSMKGMLERNNTAGKVAFVNIADVDYDPDQNEGIDYIDAMETIHAVKRDGEVLTGTEALRALYDAVGMGWYGTLSTMPVVSDLIDVLYDIISKLRLPIGKGMDAIIAAKRMKMTQEGKETCQQSEHDEECDAPEW